MKSQEENYDIILQKTTEASMPTKSAAKAAINTNLAFFILIALVYIAIVYKVVSVEPIIVEAIRPIKESTPKFCMISVATAIEALPDIGLSTAKGRISAGIFNKFNKGNIKFVTASIIPDALNILIDKNNPKSVGKIFTTI